MSSAHATYAQLQVLALRGIEATKPTTRPLYPRGVQAPRTDVGYRPPQCLATGCGCAVAEVKAGDGFGPKWEQHCHWCGAVFESDDQGGLRQTAHNVLTGIARHRGQRKC